MFTTRNLGATLAAAAAIVAGLAGLGTATASAQPGDGTQCSTMTMASGQGAADPSAMTRAGQVRTATGPNSASDGSMAVDCAPASHG